jgi:hypothetical protein
MVLALTFEVLKFVLPAIVLFFTVRLIVLAYLKNEELKRSAAGKPQLSQITLPLRLQAYERLILLLERMTPGQVLHRTLQPGMTAFDLQIALTQAIREEFDHNVTQQIYISSTGWALTKKAKEEFILLINKIASEMNSDASSHDLAKNILETWGQLEENPVQAAIDKLKSEVEEIL